MSWACASRSWTCKANSATRCNYPCHYSMTACSQLVARCVLRRPPDEPEHQPLSARVSQAARLARRDADAAVDAWHPGGDRTDECMAVMASARQGGGARRTRITV